MWQSLTSVTHAVLEGVAVRHSTDGLLHPRRVRGLDVREHDSCVELEIRHLCHGLRRTPSRRLRSSSSDWAALPPFIFLFPDRTQIMSRHSISFVARLVSSR